MVGIVALPLSMALGIAVGVPPQHGLYTALIAGAVVALLGGCKFQVTGPTAAFIVVLAPIVTKYGLSGLLTAGFMAGVMLVGMGVARLGRLIQYIPHPVTTGFTTGIATVIATLQIKDVFGLRIDSMPEHYTEKLRVLWNARGSANAAELFVAALTFAALLLVPRVIKKVPAPLIALTLASVAAALLNRVWPDFSVATIGSRFRTVVDGVEVAGIPPVLPSPSLPWSSTLSFEAIRDLFPAAFAIAMLGAIESLLCAVVADGMAGTKHDPNAELLGQGIGNLVAPLFGGITATAALARTATNVKAGAFSPLSGIVHAGVVLLAMLLLAPLFSYLPMSALAALLLMVAWNMSEAHHVVHAIKVAPRTDVLVLLVCLVLTVLFDMVLAVGVGLLLAAGLFIKRMSDVTDTASLPPDYHHALQDLPEGVMAYAVRGPLFFGAAEKALDTLRRFDREIKVVIVEMSAVPFLDLTALAALESIRDDYRRHGIGLVLVGTPARVRLKLRRAGIHRREGELAFVRNLAQAREKALHWITAQPFEARA